MKLEISEAHLKVFRAWVGDFWSRIRRAMCCCVGTGNDVEEEDEEDEEMGLDWRPKSEIRVVFAEEEKFRGFGSIGMGVSAACDCRLGVESWI